MMSKRRPPQVKRCTLDQQETTCRRPYDVATLPPVVREEFPGELRTGDAQRILTAAIVVSEAIVEFMEYLSEEGDMTYQWDPFMETMLQDMTLQYLPDITSTLAEFFMCGHRLCLWVGDPAHWIHNAFREQLRCPRCLQEYDQDNILLVLHKGDMCQAWPCQVAPHIRRLLNHWKGMWNNLDGKLFGLTHRDIVQHVRQTSRVGKRLFYQSYTFDKQYAVNVLNADKNLDFWTYSHLEGDGHLLGFHFQYTLETKKLHTDELSAILEPFHVSRPSLLPST